MRDESSALGVEVDGDGVVALGPSSEGGLEKAERARVVQKSAGPGCEPEMEVLLLCLLVSTGDEDVARSIEGLCEAKELGLGC